ncbi:GNAT family N-acetyltransferase [Cellulomonas xiejunii]|uniref:GNAT family N-acetyltransferase n=1 Tax=Cellulomonas xiejunii TaxID=2968083 RepID=A0ABY5KMN1_9CELL|nr:GNAT family N-acetyltransferase [Cellulomonas xiejunii]MCC2313648.1 GNAT family N-acetyltransferase [Cellulomonas xiejunii]MCC2321140.1 GNAT family N-acetyltransferase [Cellulomonas xiejunii]UUI71731.1 GNAT family N-acetyltransferase [Cellulomonas xiejunii]
MRSVPGVPVVIRAATPGDAAGCANVHHTSWVETYSGLLPAAHWESDTLERRTVTWQRWLDGGAEVTVAEAGGQVVGIAIGGAGRQVGDHQPVRDSELFSLYVLAAHHGTGIGQVLLDAVLAPGTPAQLWVAESNPRARRFYERNGFLPDGARFVDERLDLAEVRHVR